LVEPGVESVGAAVLQTVLLIRRAGGGERLRRDTLGAQQGGAQSRVIGGSGDDGDLRRYIYHGTPFDHVAGASSLPGLRIPAGSNAAFTARCRRRPTGPSSAASQSRFSRPTPCSPVQVPPSSWPSRMMSSNTSAARR